ncbi:MAG: S8 family serine peptidase, partial [Bdellovibrionales bacterium]|nr:S8 family serine peptidase [Bdellovibrionales bacterium]
MKLKILMVLGVSLFSTNIFAQTIIKKGHQYVPGEILVKYKSSISPTNQKLAIEREGGVRLQRVTDKGWARVKIRDGRALKDAMTDYKSDPDVESVQPNFIYHANAITPNDTRFAQEWGLKNTAQTIATAGGPDSPESEDNPGTSGNDMGLTYAWDTITDCSAITVAVVDTGVNYNHGDLAANMWTSVTYPNHGYNFVDNNDDPMDKNGHGTHV